MKLINYSLQAFKEITHKPPKLLELLIDQTVLYYNTLLNKDKPCPLVWIKAQFSQFLLSTLKCLRNG